MKRTTILAAMLAVLVATPTIIQSAQAGPAQSTELSAKRNHHSRTVDASGNVASACVISSRKTGASARVGCAHVGAFQGYLDDLEANGATVYFVGGIRRGKCWSGGMHPCGKAIDVCQLARGRVAAKCHLPGRREIAAIAERHGLFEGGRWCSSDYGHAQVGVSASACGETRMAARRHRHRVASR